MSAAEWDVEVNEASIWAAQSGSRWWNLWRLRMEGSGRITVVTASIGGDLVRVACDGKDDAAWLRGHMTGFAGIPASAVKVKRRTAGRDAA
jgi:hypothetical protein